MIEETTNAINEQSAEQFSSTITGQNSQFQSQPAVTIRLYNISITAGCAKPSTKNRMESQDISIIMHRSKCFVHNSSL